LDYVREKLQVQDETSFIYYVYKNIEVHDFRRSVDNFLTQIERLSELLEDYEFDDEFRSFFDKVIKDHKGS
jgi:hypothetical protein